MRKTVMHINNNLPLSLLSLVLITISLLGCAASSPGTSTWQSTENQALPTLAPMLERATPAVVNISTEGRIVMQRHPLLEDPFFRRFFGFLDGPQERRTQSLGSGVVVDATQGYVVTNYHLIDQADTITVTLLDGRQLSASVIGSDPETDVAVLQIPTENLTALPLADSNKLRVGDFVVAIGNPFGLGQTVTSGIVSALGRNRLGIEGYEDFIQTDASINPGNSGGALVNLRGEAVGINTAIIAPSGGNVGIGFAIPSNIVQQLMKQLIAFGEVRRGRLGVSVQDLTPDLAQAFGIATTQGAVIAKVLPDSAAQRAGLKTGDIVVAINDRPIRDAQDLRNAIGLSSVGSWVTLALLREGKPMTLRVRLSELTNSSIQQQYSFSSFSEYPTTFCRYAENITPSQLNIYLLS